MGMHFEAFLKIAFQLVHLGFTASFLMPSSGISLKIDGGVYMKRIGWEL
jgi:hypothetical protein